MQYTWDNGRVGNAAIRERLDRVVSNPKWRLMFPKAIVSHIVCTKSNHLALVLNTAYDKDKRIIPCCFMSAWLRDEVNQISS